MLCALLCKLLDCWTVSPVSMVLSLAPCWPAATQGLGKSIWILEKFSQLSVTSLMLEVPGQGRGEGLQGLGRAKDKGWGLAKKEIVILSFNKCGTFHLEWREI